METFLTIHEEIFNSALKPSLVEWKPRGSQCAGSEGCPLKPSLVEWKLAELVRHQIAGADLETFLGGMETSCENRAILVACGPLKPSLVEWKRERFLQLPPRALRLETFLEVEIGRASCRERV